MAKKRKQLDGRQEVMLGFAEDAAERGQHFFYVLIHEARWIGARNTKTH